MTDTEHLVLAKATLDPTSKSYRYLRSMSIPQEKLSIALNKQYKCTNSIITTSGTDAIYTLINGIHMINSFKPLNFIVSDQVYSSTPKIFSQYIATFAPNSTLTFINITEPNTIIETFITNLNQDNILFIESCSNPLGYIFDHTIIPKLRSLSKTLTIITDNTWLTEIIYNPFTHNTDFVILSLTKYYSAGNAIAGAILSNDTESMKKISLFRRITGHHISPDTCSIILKHMLNITHRIIKSSELTIATINHFDQHPKIKSIIHPSLSHHVSHHLISYFAYMPSVFCIILQSDIKKSQLSKKLKKCEIFDLKTSFGYKTSRFDPYTFKIEGLPCIRISIGYKDSMEKIIGGITELLDMV